MPGYDPTTLPEFHDIGIGPTPHPPLLRVAQLAAVDVRANGQHDLTAMARKTTPSPHSHHPWPALAPGPLFATRQTSLTHSLAVSLTRSATMKTQ